MSAEQEALDAAKAECAEGETPEEHEAHRQKLEEAYAAFAGRQDSNPAPPGITEIDAAIVVSAEAGA